ncbi:MAG: UDP-N-acetylmuramoyl-L-alanyl-D-glutamate--2,6-diaminopimelate ligase [Planctomycetota bacterium]
MGYSRGALILLDHAEVLARTGAEFSGPLPSHPFRGLRSDDRSREGDLFVAVRGVRYDSHQAIPQLPAHGIRGVVGEVAPPPRLPIPHYKVTSSRRVLALLEQAFAGDPTRQLRVVGVTGTNGKSTTVRILATILEALGRRVGWLGTVSGSLAGYPFHSSLTTPEPRELARAGCVLVARQGQDLVLEVSSQALHQERVAGIEFQGGLLTNFTRDHRDYHGSQEAYLAAKLRLLESVVPGAPVVLPLEGPLNPGHPCLAGKRALFFGQESGDGFVESMALSTSGLEGSLCILGEPVSFQSSLMGRHNLLNILAAALMARALEVPAECISRGIASTPPVPGRLEAVLGGRGQIYVDYAHTPEALRTVLHSLREFTSKKLIVVFGCGGDRDQGKRPEMGRIAAELADRTFITSDNPRHEEPEQIIAEILAGLDESERRQVTAVKDRREAICAALSELGQDDTLVVAGKGHETEQLIHGRRLPFDDRQVIREMLAARQCSRMGPP